MMWGPWGGSWMMFWGLLFVALVVVGIVLLVRGAAEGPAPSGRAARDILDERFARGEIDREEYEARRAALGGR